MPNSTEEYLPSPSNQAPQKAFRLAPVEDDLTSLILATRMEALCNRRLSKPARLLFSLILEMSVRRSTNVAPGILRISDVKLADMIGAGRKSVSRWKAELLRANLVRFGHYFMPNTWPLTIWYVAALVPKNPHETKTTEAGLWGNGQRRGNNSLQRPMWVKPDPCGSKTPENAQSPEMTPGTGQECPAPRVTGDAGQGSQVTPGKGQGCPAPGVTTDPPPASPLTRPRRHGRPVPGVTTDPHEKAQDVEKAVVEDGELSVQRDSTLKMAVGKAERKDNKEGIFLLDVKEVCERWRKGSGKAELDNSGAWWRLGFRADSNLMAKVLAETSRAVKEGQVRTTPGQYAVDLWKRWGGKLP